MAAVSASNGGSLVKVSSKIKKQKEDAPAKKGEEREARIDYTLDMVVHDLVSQGHLHPAKSYLLKTPEMREHIGKMCDRLNKRKKEEEMQRRKLTKSRSSFTKNLADDTFTNSQRGFAPSDPTVGSKSVDGETKGGKMAKSNDNDEEEDDAEVPAKDGAADDGFTTLKEVSPKLQPWVTPRDIVDDHARRSSLLHNNNHHRTSAASNTTNNTAPKIRRELRVPSEMQSMYSASRHLPASSAQAYRAKVDMSGFKNDEISLDLDDRRLIITAQRQKKGLQNARKVTEVIDIPECVDLEHLKIGRRLDGTLLIEEFVPDAN